MIEREFESQFVNFHDLMKFRVRDILLVSSFYDAFVLEEDGRLSDKIFSEYVDLNLTSFPRIAKVASADEALKELNLRSFDLVITMSRISDMDPGQFGQKVRERYPNLPVILLTFEYLSDEFLADLRKSGNINRIFYWFGDAKILLAIIKYVEDLSNADDDIRLGVKVILVIEDSPRFYSKFLSLVYTEIMTQTRILISEGVNDLHRLLRMRARPKILLAQDYEQGMALYQKYKKSMLGVISDIKFPCQNCMDEMAGFRFADKVKQEYSDLPFLLQSSNLENRQLAYDRGLDFIYKNSDNLMMELHRFILANFGFGDFVFKDGSGGEIGRAKNLHEFSRWIKEIPDSCLEYHASRNHISIWLRARTEFEAADRLRPAKVSDFPNIDGLRNHILNEIQRIIQKNQKGVITDFGRRSFDLQHHFIRLGKGSLGGKARGIAFLNALLVQTSFPTQFGQVDIKTPQTFALCSEVFEEFIDRNNLAEFAMDEDNDEIIADRFLQSPFPRGIRKDLEMVINHFHCPLAIRSSSIFEDSQMLPFAGLYSTFMIPNNQTQVKERLNQLIKAIKLVYASVYYKSPKEYVRNIHLRIEEEKMAVVIQNLVGQKHHQRFYPTVSGVAQSYNFYPFLPMKSEDGIVQLALGLGAIITEGFQIYRFSPLLPLLNPPYSSPTDFLKKSQSFFYALDLSNPEMQIQKDEKFSLRRHDIAEAEKDGTLNFVGSTYCQEDDVIRDTLGVKGPRLVSFAPLLKYGSMPLADMLSELLKTCRQAFGSHVEIEFALNLFNQKERKSDFNLLQIRPMVVGREMAETEVSEEDRSAYFCFSRRAFGNAVIRDIYDIVAVEPDSFDISKSRAIAREVGQMNRLFIDQKRGYILIGFGRWGTADSWLGIPVGWPDISQARVIVESSLKNFHTDPSQGSHFFHNIISLKVGYFHIHQDKEGEFVDWDWLRNQNVHQQFRYVKHFQLKKPLTVKINAQTGSGVVIKST